MILHVQNVFKNKYSSMIRYELSAGPLQLSTSCPENADFGTKCSLNFSWCALKLPDNDIHKGGPKVLLPP